MKKINSQADVMGDWKELLQAVQSDPEVQPSVTAESESLAQSLARFGLPASASVYYLRVLDRGLGDVGGGTQAGAIELEKISLLLLDHRDSLRVLEFVAK